MQKPTRKLLIPAALFAALTGQAWAQPGSPEEWTEYPPQLSQEQWAELGYTSLFNGKDLTGWEGPPDAWWVEAGALTWENTAEDPLDSWPNLIWRGGEPGDFDLFVDFRVSDKANTGVNFRGEERDNWVIKSYQADITGNGNLTGTIWMNNPHRPRVKRGQHATFDETGEHSVEEFGDPEELLKKAFRPGEWNTIRVVCEGPEMTYYLNGVLISKLTDKSPKATNEGKIALQMHQGPPMKVQFKNIYLKEME